ncbi:MAG TPA: UbiD family decarboxylase [Syntrophales bacterium]|nr:UbiD family decarboxylase [Syntrophales bacterium]
MAFKDLREFLDKLEKEGEVKRIGAEVDWNDEIAAIGQEAAKKELPALIFENIKDYQDTPGRKVLFNVLGTYQRIALALGLPKDTHIREIMSVWRERTKNPIKPILVSTGPCKEVVKKGDDINVLDFPILKLHPKDGGRYIHWSVCITKDPETGWVNAAMYNSMIFDKKTISTSPIRTQHMAIHARKYEAMGKPMPFAIAIGCEPVTSMVGTAPFPMGVNEFDMAGGLRQQPVDLVKCETVDLEVPATAEIVIEGLVDLDPKNFRPEGPFGRYSGYYTSVWSTNMAPVVNVTCITHRKDPIFDADNNPARFYGAIKVCTITHSAGVWDVLEESGIKATGVWTDGSAHWSNIFVSIDKSNYGEAKQVAAAIWGGRLSAMKGKYVVVVDSDIDIFDFREINHAIAFRTRGQEDIVIFPNTMGSALDPGIHPDSKAETIMGKWDRVLIDATWPFEWKAREEWGGLKHPPSALADPGMVEKVKNRWKEYGL